MLLGAGTFPSSECRPWGDSQHWWERALSSVVGIEVTRITLVFRVTRRLEAPVAEEKPRITQSVDGQVRETEAVAQRWHVELAPLPPGRTPEAWAVSALPFSSFSRPALMQFPKTLLASFGSGVM